MEGKHPLSAEEAREAVEVAIGEDRYEDAARINELADKLQFLEDFTETCDLVWEFYENYAEEQERWEIIAARYEDEVLFAKNGCVKSYLNKLNQLKRKQEAELDNFLSEWERARIDTATEYNNRREEVLRSARLLASCHQFAAAAEMRDRREKGEKSLAGIIRELDRTYKANMEALYRRHESEAEELKGQFMAESDVLERLRVTATQSGFENFLFNNSAALTKLINHFPPDGMIPGCLRQKIRLTNETDAETSVRVNTKRKVLGKMGTDAIGISPKQPRRLYKLRGTGIGFGRTVLQ